jgi:hypothetical protein
MKKTVIALVILLATAGIASAQPWSGQGGMMGPGANNFGQRSWAPAQTAPTLEKITLEGTLELVNARVAIKKDAKTYYVMIPSRLYGFVDGLKEGASVKVEGYVHDFYGVKDSYAVRAEKLTIAGKTIDLGTAAGTAAPFGAMRGGPNGGGMMGGRGGMKGGMMGGSPRGNAPMGYWGR